MPRARANRHEKNRIKTGWHETGLDPAENGFLGFRVLRRASLRGGASGLSSPGFPSRCPGRARPSAPDSRRRPCVRATAPRGDTALPLTEPDTGGAHGSRRTVPGRRQRRPEPGGANRHTPAVGPLLNDSRRLVGRVLDRPTGRVVPTRSARTLKQRRTLGKAFFADCPKRRERFDLRVSESLRDRFRSLPLAPERSPKILYRNVLRRGFGRRLALRSTPGVRLDSRAARCNRARPRSRRRRARGRAARGAASPRRAPTRGSRSRR